MMEQSPCFSLPVLLWIANKGVGLEIQQALPVQLQIFLTAVELNDEGDAGCLIHAMCIVHINYAMKLYEIYIKNKNSKY